MVRWIVDSIPHSGPLEPFFSQPVLPNWCNKDRDMYYSTYDIVHMKDPFLLFGKSNPRCNGSEFPLSLSDGHLS